MRLVFVNRFFYPDFSATSQMLSDAAFYLAEKGHEVHVVTSRLRYEGEGALAAVENIRGVQVHRIWTTRFGRGNLLGRALDYLTFYVSVYFSLLRLLQPGDCVVAKTDPPMLSVPVGWAGRMKKARVINWLQDLFPEVAMALGMRVPAPLARALTALRNASLVKAARNIAIGELMRTRLLDLGVPAEKVVTVHNWADGQAIQPLAESNTLRQQWSLEDRFIVGYSGNLGRAHEIDTLVDAMAAMSSDEGLQFLFIGGGALHEALRDEVQRRSIDHVMYQPYQPRAMLAQSLTLPDVHVTILRPEMEGLIVPSKFYGIIAAGRPQIFIGDPGGELGRIIADEEIGLAVAVGDASDLVEAIRALRDNASLRERMGMNARRLYEERLNAVRSLEKLEQVLC